jgi:hypothetical protein
MSTCYECGRNECGCADQARLAEQIRHLSQIEALTAERDRLQGQATAHLDCDRTNDALIKQLYKERDRWAAEAVGQRPLIAARDTLAAQLARAETVVEAAVHDVPTDHVMGILADLMVDAAYADQRAWFQSVYDEIKAFEAVVDAYQATPATTEGAGDA